MSPVCFVKHVPGLLRSSAPRARKGFPQASALRLCSPSLRFVLSASLQGWAIPLGLLVTTLPLAWKGHVKLAPPVDMMFTLNALVPPNQRGHVVLLLDATRRHAEWYAPGFKILGHWPEDPDHDPAIANASAIYTDSVDFLKRTGWQGWSMKEVKSFKRSPVIYLKHARCRLYLLERKPALSRLA